MSETWVAPVRAVRAQKILASTPRYARADVIPLVPAACKGCVWVRTDSGTAMCPFARCVRWEGWVATKEVTPVGDLAMV